ncbi:hypothetical protein AKAW_11449 [Aspergillus luchuensis IFO 4308]|nr:hypothetical protein AKAW_11449 [Aspergillus luchuensis IFO 4308]
MPKSTTQPLPTSLPFPAQHRILRVLQQRLERSAFESIQKWHPQLGQTNGWDCAENVELHMAFRALDRKRRTHSASALLKIPKKGVNRLITVVFYNSFTRPESLQPYGWAIRSVGGRLSSAKCGSTIFSADGWHAPTISKAIWLCAWDATGYLKTDITNSSCARRRGGSWRNPITIVLSKWTTSYN